MVCEGCLVGWCYRLVSIAPPLPCHDTLDRPRRKLLLPSLVLLGHSRVDAYGSVGLQYSSEAPLQHDETTTSFAQLGFTNTYTHARTHARTCWCLLSNRASHGVDAHRMNLRETHESNKEGCLVLKLFTTIACLFKPSPPPMEGKPVVRHCPPSCFVCSKPTWMLMQSC